MKTTAHKGENQVPKSPEYTITLDSKEWRAMVSDLNVYLNVPNLPKRVLDLALHVFRVPAKVCRIEYCSTRGTRIIAKIKPSDGFRNLVLACRAVEV
jgi:hypothetical protein